MATARIESLPFAEQIRFFRGKLNLPTDRWDDILNEAHDRAFIVAGAAKADLLEDLRKAVDGAIAEGRSIDWFRAQFQDIVAKHGWQYRGEFNWRTRVIYQTNLASSYAAGRWAQLNDPDLVKSRPFWRYKHSDSVMNPRPLHLAWDGLTLPRDDPWWKAHFPPNGWGCQCRVVAATRKEFDQAPLKKAPDDGTRRHVDSRGRAHEVPNGVDYGFGYAPGRSLQELKTLGQQKAEAAAGPPAPPPSPAIPPVSAAFTRLPRSGPSAAMVKDGLQAIDQTHGDGVLPPIPIAPNAASRANGSYHPGPLGSAKKIEINGNRADALTVVHEVGHFLHHQAIGKPGSWDFPADIWADFLKAADASQAVAGMRAKVGLDFDEIRHRRYLLQPLEIWARAYAQFVTRRSGSKPLQAGLDRRRALPGMDAFGQWSDADFEPLEQAIEAMLTKLGWVR